MVIMKDIKISGTTNHTKLDTQLKAARARYEQDGTEAAAQAVLKRAVVTQARQLTSQVSLGPPKGHEDLEKRLAQARNKAHYQIPPRANIPSLADLHEFFENY
jgi:hypothetical protein